MNVEEGEFNNVDSMIAFSDKQVRLGFIRKVYGILCGQLLVTCAIIGLFMIRDVKSYMAVHTEFFWIALVLLLVSLITLTCCGNLRRKSPHNMIFLGIFTLCEGFFMGCVTSVYQADEVLLAVGITSALVLGLTVFAMQSKIDFTAFGGVLMVALLCFVLFGFFALLLPSSPIVNIVYSCIGAFIFAVYIIFDTQMMLGGTHKYSISPEEYIFASLNLYLDVINLFMYILNIIGSANR